MSTARYEQMRMVFLAARELPAEQRESYVRRTCADDEPMRVEVMELLVNADGAKSFLEQPIKPRDVGINVSADVFGVGGNGVPAASGSKTRGDIHPGDAGFLEGYELLSEIHRGGQGVVYKALQKSTNRHVAIKLLPEGPMASDRQKQRFEREVTLAANLRHPNIVTVYDSGLTSGRYYYVMEYVHGQPLNEFVAAKALRVDEKLRLFATICAAVSHAHLQNVIHRDLKPGNILVDSRGSPRVVDFGLAKMGTFDAGGSGSPLTVTSQFMGTLAYASPEQTMGDPSMVDARSDVYSLGVILFEMLTGRLPYPITQDVVATFKMIREREAAKPSKLTSDLDSDVDTIVLRALAKDPARRYQSVADLHADIQRYLNGEPIAARRDSVVYVLHKRGTEFSRRHRIATSAVIVLLAVVLSELLVIPAVTTVWRGPINAFERLAASLPGPAIAGTPYQDMVLVAIDDETDRVMQELAKAEGFTDVDLRANHRSIRRMHGRLFERLAGAGIKGLAWDGVARKPTEYDDDLIKGIKSLLAAGVRPTFAAWGWAMDTRPDEMIAPEVRNAGVAWGCPSMQGDESTPWRMDLIVERGGTTQLLGFPVAAVAAFRHPDKEVVSARLNKESNELELRVASRDSSMTQTELFGVVERVPVSAVRQITSVGDDETDLAFELGDVVGELLLRLPTDEQIRSFTIPYHRVMTSSPAELRTLFAGKLVVLGDCRNESINTDWVNTPDGRRLPGVVSVFLAIDGILRNSQGARFAGNTGWFAVVTFGAIAGVLVWIIGRGRAWRIAVFSVLTCVVLCLLSVLLFRFTGYLQNPLIPTLSMLTAIGVAAVLYRPPRPAAAFQQVF